MTTSDYGETVVCFEPQEVPLYNETMKFVTMARQAGVPVERILEIIEKIVVSCVQETQRKS